MSGENIDEQRGDGSGISEQTELRVTGRSD